MPPKELSVDQLRSIASEFIPARLYFACFDEPLPTADDIHCFNIDNTFIYEEYCLDFGPLNLGSTYLFCSLLSDLLSDPNLSSKQIFYCTSKQKNHVNNGAVLIASYMILSHNLTPSDAFSLFSKSQLSTFVPFHDASFSKDFYNLTVFDCISGLYKAKLFNFFDFNNFSFEEYDHFCNLQNGDLNWIIQNQFCAFSGPYETRKHLGNGYFSTEPKDYIPYFKSKNVSTVIRLNKSFYDAEHFIKDDIQHFDLFYPDGTNPPNNIIQRFLDISEEEIFNKQKAIAVHCKAGLGRTGTLIGIFIMKHFKMTAREIIGFMRIARPGSIIGPQQRFLQQFEKVYLSSDTFKIHEKNTVVTKSSKSLNLNLSLNLKNMLKVFSSKKSQSFSQENVTESEIEKEIALESEIENEKEKEIEEQKEKENENENEEVNEEEIVEKGLTQGDILNINKAKHQHKSLSLE